MASAYPLIPPEDFWSRQANAQRHSFEFSPFGAPALITANESSVIEAAKLSARRFSRSDQAGGRPMRIQLAVGGEAPPLPDDLPARLDYSGVGDWIAVKAGEWGQGAANLRAREAVAFLSRPLAADLRLVSRYFVDHYLLNFLFGEWAMLHASCVLNSDGCRLIVMVGPHGAGKSTTALRLLRAGYTFLADGMALLRPRGGRLAVGGYPVGEVKLRDDVLPLFPEYEGDAVQVREHHKTVVDLYQAHAGRLAESVIVPDAIRLCFVQLNDGEETRVQPLAADAVGEAVAAHTVYWHEPRQLEHNTAALRQLLASAKIFRVLIGADSDQLVARLEDSL